MTNLNIAKLYLASNSTATAAQIDTAVTDGTALTAINALTTAAFVEAAYQAAFGRAADAEGLAYWSNEIDVNGMAKDDAFMTALNYGATVYVAPTVDAPLVIGDTTFTAAVASVTDDVAVAANKATAEVAAAAISVGEAAAIVATVTEVATTVTAASDAVAVVVAANAPDVGETYAFTIANQAIESGSSDDTFTDGIASDTATAITLNTSDIILDGSTTDNDTMSIVWSGTAVTQAATITNVENINVDINEFSGLANLVSAANITGANITLSSDKLGFDGVSGVTGAANNTVTAGTNVTTLTVAGLTGGSIDAGSASSVTMDGTAARANTVTVNGDITLANTASTLTTLDVTADSTITYNTGAVAIQTTISGSSDVNLVMDAADIANGTTGQSLVNTGTGAVTVTQSTTAGAAFDATNFAADKIVVGNITTVAATVNSGQLLETSAAMTSLTVATTTALASTATINAGHNITTLVATNALLDTTVNATRADGLTIGTLTATGQDVILTGSVDVVATNIDVTTLDASASTGDLTLTTVGTVTETITTGSGTASITTGAVGDNLTVIAGAGNTTTNAILVHTGIVSVTGSTGVDTVEMAILGAATIAIDGGAGTDIIMLGDAGADASTTAATVWAVQNVENIVVANTAVAAALFSVNDAVDALGASMNASQLNAQTYTVSQEEAIDTLTLTVAGDVANIPSTTAQTIDLSGITMQTLDATVINGEANIANTIIGTNVADTITAGVSATLVQVNTLTGGAGDDVFVFVAGDSSEAAMNSVTDYQANALTSDNDTLNIAGGTSFLDATDSITDISANLSATVTAIFSGAANAVDAVVSAGGIMSLVGTASDVALANTLAEMIDIAEETMLDATGNATAATDAMAFEFDGNTYVVSTPATGASDIIELTGLTGITSISGAAAADGIFVL